MSYIEVTLRVISTGQFILQQITTNKYLINTLIPLNVHVGFCQTGALFCPACVNVLEWFETFLMSNVDFLVIFLKGQGEVMTPMD